MTSADLGRVYSEEWYRTFEGLEAEMRSLACVLTAELPIPVGSRVVDVGCGPAELLKWLLRLGCKVTGVEGSPYGEVAAKRTLRCEGSTSWSVRRMDLRRGGELPAGDVTVCIEVAEHLPAESADTLVKMLAGSVGKEGVLVWTAAEPGQGGHDHQNEQPPEYWTEKFDSAGLWRDADAGKRIRDALRTPIRHQFWLREGLQVFRPKRPAVGWKFERV